MLNPRVFFAEHFGSCDFNDRLARVGLARNPDYFGIFKIGFVCRVENNRLDIRKR